MKKKTFQNNYNRTNKHTLTRQPVLFTGEQLENIYVNEFRK